MATGRRLSVYQAAETLGVTVDAVRGRIKRGTIEHERDGNRVYVILAADESGTGRDQTNDQYGESGALISRLEGEVEFLRDQVRRQQEIIAQQAVTMRQLTAAAQEAPPEAAETVEEEPEGSEPRSATGSTQEATRRPWWRRMFGQRG